MDICYSENNQFTSKKPELNLHNNYFLEDKNDKQIMEMKINNCKSLKMLIKSSYDLYGRVIIYDLKILGNKY